jgi:hypothetical protein
MSFIDLALCSVLAARSSRIAHNATFTVSGACFFCQAAPRRRPSLPRDATDFRILVEQPTEPGIEPWEAELLVAVRGGQVWNPALHFKIASLSAPDTDDAVAISARLEEWARSL